MTGELNPCIRCKRNRVTPEWESLIRHRGICWRCSEEWEGKVHKLPDGTWYKPPEGWLAHYNNWLLELAA